MDNVQPRLSKKKMQLRQGSLKNRLEQVKKEKAFLPFRSCVKPIECFTL